MKSITIISILICLLISFTPAVSQTKYALIFAIGNYPDSSGWPRISSTSDVPYIKGALTRQGFEEANIKIVTDEKATIAGIPAALKDLIDKVKPGDIVVIHFSSHGEQIEDDNADEADGLDESIVTFSAVYNPNSDNFKRDQVGYLRDDQFGSLIEQLRNKLGKTGDVIVFMDLCHSGTGTRGTAKIRGDKPPMVSSTFHFNKNSRKDTAGVFREKKSSARGDENSLATYVIFSAARAEENDQETTDDNNEGVGSLTYAISKAFETLDPGTTYRSLFSKIQAVMNVKVQNQNPVLEGNGIDRVLFGGKFIQQKPYIQIDRLKGKEITLKAGLLAGLDTGAKIGVYKSGTIDPSKAIALATGTVTRSANYTATASLDKEPGIEPASGWVFITEAVYNVKPVSVQISSKGAGASMNFSEMEINSIKGVKDLPLIKFDNGAPELSIVKGATFDSIKVVSNGYLFRAVKRVGSGVEELTKGLKDYIQYKFLQNLEVKDPEINVEVKLVPVINGIADTSKINSKVNKGVYEYSEGDTMVLLLKNKGNQSIYFNVLDLQPDGVINAVLPKKNMGQYPSELKVNAGASRLFSSYFLIVNPPFGTEIFKIFASTGEIDLEEVATSKENETRGSLSVMERLVKDSYGMASRGTIGKKVSGANGGTYNLVFTIKPK